MGLSAATEALQSANLKKPEAIIVATGYGCAESTFRFLKDSISARAFIYSTANSVAAHIAMTLSATGYNNTFCHSSGAFEAAMLDAILMLSEGEASQILLGGIDEMCDLTFQSEENSGRYKTVSKANFDLFGSATPGTVAGEGAAFFILSDIVNERNLAVVENITTFRQSDDLQGMIARFLSAAGVSPDELDLVISGRNGDFSNDSDFIAIEDTLFSETQILYFKQLCGEYPVSVSFALWLGSAILARQQLPAGFHIKLKVKEIKYLLICNRYENKRWTLILLSKTGQ